MSYQRARSVLVMARRRMSRHSAYSAGSWPSSYRTITSYRVKAGTGSVLSRRPPNPHKAHAAANCQSCRRSVLEAIGGPERGLLHPNTDWMLADAADRIGRDHLSVQTKSGFHSFRGRLTRLARMTQPRHRGSGGSMYTRKAYATREAPRRGQR
jgi:hypothetical protein